MVCSSSVASLRVGSSNSAIDPSWLGDHADQSTWIWIWVWTSDQSCPTPPALRCGWRWRANIQMLNKCKVNMKRDLENSITSYNESVLTVHQVCTSTCTRSNTLLASGRAWKARFCHPLHRTTPSFDRTVKATGVGVHTSRTSVFKECEGGVREDEMLVLCYGLFSQIPSLPPMYPDASVASFSVSSWACLDCHGINTRTNARLVQDASTFLPYGGDIKPEKAFEIIEEYKAKVEAVRTNQVRR